MNELNYWAFTSFQGAEQTVNLGYGGTGSYGVSSIDEGAHLM